MQAGPKLDAMRKTFGEVNFAVAGGGDIDIPRIGNRVEIQVVVEGNPFIAVLLAQALIILLLLHDRAEILRRADVAIEISHRIGRPPFSCF